MEKDSPVLGLKMNPESLMAIFFFIFIIIVIIYVAKLNMLVDEML